MRVPLSEVKVVCTKSELALVTASRSPKLEKLSPGEAKKSAVLARKLIDKWRDLNRDQARDRSRKVGLGERDTRTQLKLQIFEEALQDFEGQVSQGESAEKPGRKPARGTPKTARTTAHRETRASVRAELAEKKSAVNAKAVTNTKSGKSAKPAAKSDAPAKPKASKAAGNVKIKSAPPATAKPKSKPNPTLAQAQSKLAATAAEKRSAATAAKQTRIARSGLTSRIRGHVSARTRRDQGRRDSR